MSTVIVCEERQDCRDRNINRWYCHADRSGSCPLTKCGGTGLSQEPGDPS